MENAANKTVVCSVLHLDIVGYSKKTVAGQISLKERFNGYLSGAIQSLPVADRIILDTGSGAAVTFLGNDEAALHTALDLRGALSGEAPDAEHPLQVRMGLNRGPVRLVMDINGQPNVVGDGVNVAQHIMGFAEPGQILSSHSYYEALARSASPHLDMFHYRGSRTDRHVREHEIYVIAEPGETTVKQVQMSTEIPAGRDAAKPHDLQRRSLYLGGLAIVLVLAGVLALKIKQQEPTPPLPADEAYQAQMSGSASPDSPAKDENVAQPATDIKPATEDTANRKPDGKAATSKAPLLTTPPATARPERTGGSAAMTKKRAGAGAFISVICKNDEAKVFVDFVQKGQADHGELNLTVPPGEHQVLVKHASGLVHKQKVNLAPGSSVRIAPKFCD